MHNKSLVVFDGICNFCNGAVNFIIKRDPRGIFNFTPMQSSVAKELIKKHHIYNVGVDTFLLIKDGKCYVYSSAALEIAKDLTGFWYLLTIFKIIPKSVMDYFYKLFARNRYVLFGKKEQCIVPSEDTKSRFLGI